MIRILQQDNKFIKIVFAVIIGFAVLTMVITLVPGIFDNVGAGQDTSTYGSVHEPGPFARYFGDTQTISQQQLSRATQRFVQQQMQGREIPPYLLPYFENQAGQQLVQLAVLKIEGDRRGLQATDDDVRHFLHQGQFGQVLFPNGQFIGDDAYMNFVATEFQETRADFEEEVKKDIEFGRLQSLITGGVTVSDNDVRDSYRVSGTKVKFDYAVINSDDLGKTLNPSDSDLQSFFKQNLLRYQTAIGETRKLEYLAFDADQLPGGKPQVTDGDAELYYNAHLANYQIPEQVKARHILISVPQGADAKTDAAARAKAEDLLKQIKAGGNFAALAAANSDDPGSKSQGGELGTFTRGKMVPEFEKAAFSTPVGQTSDPVKTSFGYHLIQVEQKDEAHTKPLAEVKAEILPLLEQKKVGDAEQAYAAALAAEVKSSGFDKTAAAHHLRAVTTGFLAKDGTIAGVSDGTAMLNVAFGTTKGAAPQTASDGDGEAVLQVVDIAPPHAPTFDEWRSHLLTDYREQQVPQMLNAQLNKLDARAKELNSLQKAAAEMNIPLKSSELVGKDGQVPQLGAMSGPASVAFTLPNAGISGPLNMGATGGVLQVTDKQEPSTEDIAKNFTQTRESLLGTQRSEVFGLYLGTLMDKYKKAGAIRLRKQPAGPGDLPIGS